MNNLDPEVAERPEDLVVYGGTGKAARNWEAYDAIVRTLRDLEPDETLLVQSGKPVGVMRTHEWAPRVLIANSNLVGDWANWEEFRRLEDLGLTMYGQMTAGSWIYIGTQGILQGTFETFAAVADKRFGGTLRRHDHGDRRARRHGRRPAARRHHERRRRDLHRVRPVPDPAPDRAPLPRRAGGLLEHAVELRRRGPRRAPRRCRSACSATPPRCCPSCSSPEAPIDIVTDQTSAHDPLFYLPAGTAFDDWERERTEDPAGFTEAGAGVDGRARAGDGRVPGRAAPRSSTTATRSATRPARAATTGRSSSRASCRPTSGRCSARARARSGGRRSPATRPTSRRPTGRSSSCSRSNERLRKWITMAQERVALPGPARADLLARLRRAAPGRASSSTRWSPPAS